MTRPEWIIKRVAVLMGGPSAEREISLRSGVAVTRGLREAGYEVEPVIVEGTTLDLPARIDAVFIALHGAFGEDGGVQDQLDARAIPYTGSGAASSRLSFDKILTKDVLDAGGVPTAPYAMLQRGQPASPLALPVVVKPARQGSTIGISKVSTAADWAPALDEAFCHDERVLAETFIPGRELTVGLLGDGEPLPIVEVVSRDGWYDFGAKYVTGETRYQVPAELDEACRLRCQELARATFRLLGCRGLGRVDFRLRPDGELFVLELNSIPGFTESSLLPKAAARAGIGFSALCDRILKLATCDVVTTVAADGERHGS